MGIMLRQPPSGGCVLKLNITPSLHQPDFAAAFGRLCVETSITTVVIRFCWQPPSSGCVLKPYEWALSELVKAQPPSSGCVLKRYSALATRISPSSRLRAAVC